jgi:pimeloyl-ACP methyl ester carboxylesterase
MAIVTSRDGTRIAYQRSGLGPAVILVSAGILDHTEYRPLAAALTAEFTVYFYDRRGRGDSDNTLPYAVEREIEDIDALVATAHADGAGRPSVIGLSSGGAIALEAAAAGVEIERVAVYEVPYCVTPETQRRWQHYIDQLWATLAEGRRDEAIVVAMRFSGASEKQIAAARTSPNWGRMESVAHILAYEAASTGDGVPPADRLSTIKQPTLVATGGISADERLGMGELPADFYDQAAAAIAASVPNSRRRVLDGQSHLPDPRMAGPILTRFFTGD